MPKYVDRVTDLAPRMTRPQKRQPSGAAGRLGARQQIPSQFARRLFPELKRLKLPRATPKFVVAVSGGADSVALLLALDELVKSKKLDVEIVVAHLNHKLRGQASDDDARWVRSLGRRLGYRVIVSASYAKK